MIPEGWKNTHLGNVADLIMGQSPPSSECNESKIGVPFFQGNGEFGDKHPIPKRWIEAPLKVVEAGDVLISVRAPVGEMNIAETRSCIGRGLAGIRATNSDQDFLYHLVQYTRKSLSKKAQGSTFEAINKDDLFSIAVEMPPLPEQKRIAEVLGGVDAAIETTKAVIEQTKKVKQGLLQTLLTRGIGHTKFKPSPLGEIPESWEVVRVAAIAAKSKSAIVDGPFGSNLKSEHYRESGVPVLQSGFATSGKFKADKYVYVSEELFREQIRSKAVGEDILMAKIGAQAGRCAIIPSDHPDSIIAGNCLKITVNRDICSNEFLFNVLTHKYETTGLREVRTETAQPAISLKNLKSLEIPLPSLLEQKEIAQIAYCVDNEITAETTKLASLQQFKKGLMHDLLTGKVRVA